MEEKAEERPVLLELFSGTGSVGKAFRARGYDIISVDSDPKARASITRDILDFDVAELGGRRVDTVWASPPCTHYSRARSGTTADELAGSDELVRKTLRIVRELGGCSVFIENPWTGRLKTRGLLDHLHVHKVDYCKYGFPYRKRTAIWTNTNWKPARDLCKHDCGHTTGRTHDAHAQQGGPGPSFSQRELYRIPDDLCAEVARSVAPS